MSYCCFVQPAPLSLAEKKKRPARTFGEARLREIPVDASNPEVAPSTVSIYGDSCGLTSTAACTCTGVRTCVVSCPLCIHADVCRKNVLGFGVLTSMMTVSKHG